MNHIDLIKKISVKDFVSMSYSYNRKPSEIERIRKGDFGLMFVVEGHATLTFKGTTMDLYKGDGTFVPINIMYKYSRHKPGKVLVLNFSVYENSVFTDFIKFHIADINHIVPYLDSLKSVFFSNTENKRLVLMSIFYNLLLTILRSVEAPNHPALKKAILYMRENLENPLLDSGVIAKESGYSEGHLRRLFKEVYKVSPMQYLNDLRIETAKKLLLSTGLSIKEISEQCGFNSPFYFSNVFKAKFGRSPARYREENNILI